MSSFIPSYFNGCLHANMMIRFLREFFRIHFRFRSLSVVVFLPCRISWDHE